MFIKSLRPTRWWISSQSSPWEVVVIPRHRNSEKVTYSVLLSCNIKLLRAYPKIFKYTRYLSKTLRRSELHWPADPPWKTQGMQSNYCDPFIHWKLRLCQHTWILYYATMVFTPITKPVPMTGLIFDRKFYRWMSRRHVLISTHVFIRFSILRLMQRFQNLLWDVQLKDSNKTRYIKNGFQFLTNVGLRYWKWFATFHLGGANCNSKQRAINLGRQLANGSARCSAETRNRRKQHDESAHEQFSDPKREKLETNNYSLRTSRRQNNRSTNAKANGLLIFWVAGVYCILERRQ